MESTLALMSVVEAPRTMWMASAWGRLMDACSSNGFVVNHVTDANRMIVARGSFKSIRLRAHKKRAKKHRALQYRFKQWHKIKADKNGKSKRDMLAVR